MSTCNLPFHYWPLFWLSSPLKFYNFENMSKTLLLKMMDPWILMHHLKTRTICVILFWLYKHLKQDKLHIKILLQLTAASVKSKMFYSFGSWQFVFQLIPLNSVGKLLGSLDDGHGIASRRLHVCCQFGPIVEWSGSSYSIIFKVLFWFSFLAVFLLFNIFASFPILLAFPSYFLASGFKIKTSWFRVTVFYRAIQLILIKFYNLFHL